MRKRFTLILVVVVGFLLLVGIISVLTTRLHQNDIKKTSDTFVSEVLNYDSSGSYALLTPNSQSKQSQDDWAQTVKKLSTFFEGATPKLQSVSQSAGFTFITYHVVGSDGNYVFKVALAQSGKTWLVQSFNSELQVD